MTEQHEPTEMSSESIVRESRIPYPIWARIKQGFRGVLLGIAMLFLVFPLYWVFSTALRPRSQAISLPSPLVPTDVTLAIFIDLFTQTLVPTWLINSAIVTVGVIFVVTVLSTLGGYGLARIDIPFKTAFARFILVGYMYPAILLSIPMFMFWRRLGILNSYLGLILALVTFTLPLGLWVMWLYFQSIPYSYEESAQMAGASPFQAFWEVALPNALPGIIAVSIFGFAVGWNTYTVPKILMTTPQDQVLVVGISTFIEGHAILWSEVMAATAVLVLPALVFVFFLQKYIMLGLGAQAG